MITKRVILYVSLRCLIILFYCLLLIDTYNAQVNDASSNCNCQITLDNSFQVVPFDGYVAPEYRNDDASSPLIEFPFEFCLFDQSYNSCYINNNGNISFGSPYGTFSSSGFPISNFVIVAPFWADVDTRNPESGLPYYKITDHYMIVIWDHVGYFNMQTDKLNTFQVIISDGSDPIIPNGNNVQFCYKDMQWTTGSASSGVNGFGGTPATVGTNKGDGFSFTQFGRFDQAGFSYDGPFLQPDGVSWLDDVGIAFDSCTPNESINVKPVSTDSGACDTLYVCAGDTMSLIYFAPELDQSISFNYESNLPQNTVYWVDQGQGYSWFNFIVPEDFNSSLSYFLELNVSDNSIPIGQIQEFYTVVASESVQLDISLLSGGDCNNIILQASPIMGNLYWNSGAQSSSLEVFSPGQYTVYSTIGSCISEASISISNENFEMQSDTNFINFQLLEGDFLDYNNSVLNTEGEFIFHFENIAGCDSVVAIELEYISSTVIEDFELTVNNVTLSDSIMISNEISEPYYLNCSGELSQAEANSSIPVTFEWSRYDTLTSSFVVIQVDESVVSSTLDNGADPGRYNVSAYLQNNLTPIWGETFWLLEIGDPGIVDVTANEIYCGYEIFGDVVFPELLGYFPIEETQIVFSQNTNIEICFNGTHTWVSDLAFYIEGPAECGSPTVLLAPNPGALGQVATCNSGDGFNLCFTNGPASNFDACINAPSSLTGIFSSYGPDYTPIQWSSLYGCPTSSSEWKLRVYDCVGGDIGTFNSGQITFEEIQFGETVSVQLNSQDGDVSAITDNSCSSAPAGVLALQTDIQSEENILFNYHWYSELGTFPFSPLMQLDLDHIITFPEVSETIYLEVQNNIGLDLGYCGLQFIDSVEIQPGISPDFGSISDLCIQDTIVSLVYNGLYDLSWYSGVTDVSIVELIEGQQAFIEYNLSDVSDYVGTLVGYSICGDVVELDLGAVECSQCEVVAQDDFICSGNSTLLVAAPISFSNSEWAVYSAGPSGGYVFYDKGNNDGGWRYLEVAPYDISAGAPWSCFGTLVEGLQSDIGSGDINTNSITQQCGSALSAASTCENAIINGFDDWYLPNQAEMNLILNTLYSQGIGSFNSGVGLNVATSQFNRYWTSSQSDLNTGIVQDFTPSGNGVSSKNNLHRVRPIRKFSDFDNLTYFWSTGASNDTIWVSPESTTTYTCSVFWNDQECTSSVEVEVISDSFSLDSSDSLLCLGETITLLETGFDAIQWSDGSQSESLTISAPGDYWASAVLSGCDVHSDTLTVSESSLIIYTEPSDTVSFCGTSVIELTAYGGDSYMWNTGELSNTLQVTSEGIYYVVGFDSDCSGVSNSVYVIEESNIDINVFTEENVLCLNSAPAQLLATPEGGTWSGIGVEGNLFYPSLSGVGAFVITYSYEDSNGCEASANIFLAVNDCVNVEEITSNLYSIYPNPTSGIVNVVAKNLSEVALQIYSADGRLVKSFDYGGVTSLLDLTPLSNGIYFVNIQDKYASYQMKLLKQ